MATKRSKRPAKPKQQRQQPKPKLAGSRGDPEPLTVPDLAQRFGCSRRTIHRWFAAGCPRGPLVEIARWAMNNTAAPGGRLQQLAGLLGDPDDRHPTLVEQRIRQQIETAEIELQRRRLELDERRQGLVNRERVKRELAAISVRVISVLRAVPDRCKFPEEVEQRCRDDVRDFCRGLERELLQMPICDVDVASCLVDAADEIRRRRAEAEEGSGAARP